MIGTAYLDSSAGLKLIVDEPESEPLRTWLAERPARASSALFRTELLRAARRSMANRVARAREVIANVTLLAIDEPLLEIAAHLDPPALRSLDAIHIATALRLGDELHALVTYDQRMIEAAERLGLPVASPA